MSAINIDHNTTPGTVVTKTKGKHNRSRGGCTRCRQRRQKCDESKPVCLRCQESGIESSCAYTVQLQWGGRNFQSYAKNADIKKYETEPGTFVYVASSSNKGKSTSGSPSPTPGPSRTLDVLDKVKPMERLLLHHYAKEAIKITSCYPEIQNDFLQLLLPMATNYPPLLSALMALSAIHRNSLFEPQSEPSNVIALKASSITKLRSELLQPCKPSESMRNAVLATALTLCMCEIHSGADQPRSWRLHLEGAKAIIGFQETRDPDPQSHSRLLERWYISIEALAALTDQGLRGEQLPSSEIEFREYVAPFYLDDYFGFSTELVQVFKEIGAAARERREIGKPDAHASLSEEDLEEEANILEGNVRDMIRRDQNSPPSFYPGIAERLSPEATHEFYLCNEAYQQTALIHIYRRVRKIPKTDPAVQQSVKRILECCTGITPRTGLSPYIVLTMPLFTAGKEALEEDREYFRVLIRNLYESLKLRNVLRSLDFLEAYWLSEDNPSFSSPEDDEDCDFIPY